MTYDLANRLRTTQLVSGGTEYYSYSPDNKRILKRTPSGESWSEEWTMYGARGEKLGNFTMGCQPNNGYSCPYALVLTPTISFAGRVIWDKSAEVRADRLGTNRISSMKFYPYGEEIGTATANDRVKFVTYTRDGFTGLDYADQRYYAAGYGRFNTADPYRASAGAGDPGSWNRYAYVGGDPINYSDRHGLQKETCFYVDGELDSCEDEVEYAPGGAGGNEQAGNGGGGGGGGKTTSPQNLTVEVYGILCKRIRVVILIAVVRSKGIVLSSSRRSRPSHDHPGRTARSTQGRARGAAQRTLACEHRFCDPPKLTGGPARVSGSIPPVGFERFYCR